MSSRPQASVLSYAQREAVKSLVQSQIAEIEKNKQAINVPAAEQSVKIIECATQDELSELTTQDADASVMTGNRLQRAEVHEQLERMTDHELAAYLDEVVQLTVQRQQKHGFTHGNVTALSLQYETGETIAPDGSKCRTRSRSAGAVLLRPSRTKSASYAITHRQTSGIPKGSTSTHTHSHKSSKASSKNGTKGDYITDDDPELISASNPDRLSGSQRQENLLRPETPMIHNSSPNHRIGTPVPGSFKSKGVSPSHAHTDKHTTSLFGFVSGTGSGRTVTGEKLFDGVRITTSPYSRDIRELSPLVAICNTPRIDPIIEPFFHPSSTLRVAASPSPSNKKCIRPSCTKASPATDSTGMTAVTGTSISAGSLSLSRHSSASSVASGESLGVFSGTSSAFCAPNKIKH